MFDAVWKKISEFIDAIRSAVHTAISDLITWLSQVVLDAIVWLLDLVGYWVSPVVDWMIVLLPDPTGQGFQRIFEAYHFSSAWFDYDALYYVVALLLLCHTFAALLHLVLFIAHWVAKVIETLTP